MERTHRPHRAYLCVRAVRHALVVLAFSSAVEHCELYAQNVAIASSRISITYDNWLQRHIRWLPAKDRCIVAIDPPFKRGSSCRA